MRIVALSDTHGHHRDVTVPDGDVIVFGGDLMTCGRKFREIQDFAAWMHNLPHKHKVMIAGNHDLFFEHSKGTCVAQFRDIQNFKYLQNQECTIEGFKFWGSPVSPWFCNWAFNVHRGPDIKNYWDRIPKDTDVLITHGPPHGTLDQAISSDLSSNWGSQLIVHPSEHLGCEELKAAVDRINPKVHIFGHIHGGYGHNNDAYNASVCNEQYNPVNEPHIIDIER